MAPDGFWRLHVPGAWSHPMGRILTKLFIFYGAVFLSLRCPVFFWRLLVVPFVKLVWDHMDRILTGLFSYGPVLGNNNCVPSIAGAPCDVVSLCNRAG